MRPFTSTIPLEEARRLLNEAARPIVRLDRVPLEGAGGRISAEDVSSAIDVPPFARSVMDGYAVVSSDTAGASRDEREADADVEVNALASDGVNVAPFFWFSAAHSPDFARCAISWPV